VRGKVLAELPVVRTKEKLDMQFQCMPVIIEDAFQ
jgi:hypothetical protein